MSRGKGNQFGKGRYIGREEGRQEGIKIGQMQGRNKTIGYSIGSFILGTLLSLMFRKK